MISISAKSARIFQQVDSLLRGDDPLLRSAGQTRVRLATIFAIIVGFGMLYGAAMGSFGGIGHGRAWAMLFSGLKVPMLLVVTFALSLPSFWVLNTLAGLAGDFKAVLAALLAAQAGLTIVLVSLAPFTLFWYASSNDYYMALLMNTIMFMIASIAAQRLLRRYYGPLIRRNPRHRLMRRVWLVIFAFVGIQFAWLLRPFVGNPLLPVRFFRADSLGNAYVNIAQELLRAILR